ncbi:hypothetical protein D9M68_950210 [compost metagenome]
MQHALGAQLVGLAIAVQGEGEAIAFATGAVVPLAVAVTEGPPTVGQAVERALVIRVAPLVSDGIVVGTQAELVGQAQRTIPVQTEPQLLFAGAEIAVIIAGGRDPPGLAPLTLEGYPAATHLLAGQQFQLRRA